MRLSTTFRLAACAIFGAALVLGQTVPPGLTPAAGPNPNMLPSPPANASVISGRFALEDGTPPPGAIAYGQTELEALQSSIDKVDAMLEALHGDRSEHRFEWSDPGEF